MSRRRRIYLFAALAMAVLVVVLIVWWNTSEASVTLANGSRLTCRAVAVATSASSSLRPDSPFDKLARRLPAFLRQFMARPSSRLPTPDGTNIVFWLELDRGYLNTLSFALRDDRGTHVVKLDPMTQRLPDGKTRILLRESVWPRRARHLVLQIFDSNLDSKTQLAAEMRVPNPRWQSYPEWKPDPLPIAVRLDETEIKLERFEIRPQPVMLQRLSRTNLVEHVAFIQFRRMNATNAGISSRWTLDHASLVDATGNNRPLPIIPDLYEEKIQTYGVKIPWPGEAVYRLDTWWRQRDGTGTNAASRIRQLSFTVQPERRETSVPARLPPTP
jgi:hypothetical protein